jgi:hypothetical protein
MSDTGDTGHAAEHGGDVAAAIACNDHGAHHSGDGSSSGSDDYNDGPASKRLALTIVAAAVAAVIVIGFVIGLSNQGPAQPAEITALAHNNILSCQSYLDSNPAATVRRCSQTASFDPPTTITVRVQLLGVTAAQWRTLETNYGYSIVCPSSATTCSLQDGGAGNADPAAFKLTASTQDLPITIIISVSSVQLDLPAKSYDINLATGS